MSNSRFVRCTECGHAWDPRHPIDEYREFGGDSRLKCNGCGQGQRGSFELVTPETVEDESTLSVVDQAEIAGLRRRIRDRIEQQFDHIVGKAPDDFVETDSGEYQWSEGTKHLPFWCDTDDEYAVAYELLELYDRLEVVTDQDEAEAVNDRLDEFIQMLEPVTERKTTIDKLDEEIAELEATIAEKQDKLDDLTTELTATREQVEAFEDDKGMELPEISAFVEEHQDLIVDVDELSIERERLEVEVGDFESRDEAFKFGFIDGHSKGYEEAKASYRITYPCAVCGEAMPIQYGSDVHRQVWEYLREQKWGHAACHQQNTAHAIR